jgi:hypothetical protein
MGNVRLTGVGLAPGVVWYGDFTTAKLLLRDTTLPLSIVNGVVGMRLADVVEHPVLRGVSDVIIQPADISNGNVTLNTDYTMVQVADPLEWPDTRMTWRQERDEMRRRQDDGASLAA